jgi:hypothetical protein
MNNLAYVLLVCVLFAIVMYVVNNFFTIEAKLKGLVNLILLILFLFWVLAYSGLFFGHPLIVR